MERTRPLAFSDTGLLVLLLPLAACGGTANAERPTADSSEECEPTTQDCPIEGEPGPDGEVIPPSEPEGFIPDSSDDDESGPAADDDDASGGDDDGTEPGAPAPEVELADCLTRAESATGLDSGSALVDEYFREVSRVRAAPYQARAAELFPALADIVGSEATAADVVTAYRAWTELYTTSGVALLMWSPRCPVAASDLWDVAMRCDPALPEEPEALSCDGTCIDPSAGECAAGSALCRDAMASECTGFCEGSCGVALDGEGSCAGPCDGLCVSPGDTGCGDTELVCQGAFGEPLPCDTVCEGEWTPPEATSAECAAVDTASVSLAAVCSAPTPSPLYEPAEDQDADALAAFDADLAEFLDLTREVMELHSEAMLLLQAGATLSAALEDILAVELAFADDDTAACVTTLGRETPSLLGSAGAEVNEVLLETSALVSGIQ